MPEYAPTDNGRQVRFVSKAATVLFVSQEVDRQWQTTAGQQEDQTLASERTDKAIERHW